MDGLQTLLGMSSVSNQTPKPYTPNVRRNPARTAALSRFFGLPDDGSISQTDLESAYTGMRAEDEADAAARAAAAVYPERVKGEYGLAQERLRGSSAQEVARINAERVAQERDAQREFQMQQNELNRNAAMNRLETSQTGLNTRAQTYQGGVAERQRRAQNEGRARALEAGKVAPTYPAREGVWQNLQYLFGLGPYDRQAAAQAEAAQLRNSAPGDVGDEDLLAIASDYAPYHNLDDAALLDVIRRTQPDASPDEQQMLLNIIRSNR